MTGERERERGERKAGVFTPNSHVRSSEVSNWQTFESHFADERIKWQSAQKLLQNIRITEMFLLLYIYSVYMHICYDIVFSFLVYLHFAVQNFLAFRNLLFHTVLPLLPPPVSIGMCIEFYFSALHTDKLF